MRWYYRHLVAAGGASAICALMLANLVGFGGGGVDGVRNTLRQLLDGGGLSAAAMAWALLFVGVEIMQALERWRGQVK